MKDNKEILDEFGNKVIEYVYDDGLRYLNQILTNTTKWNAGKEFIEAFSKLDKGTQAVLTKYVKELLGTSLFAFLKIFEENEQFKLIYEEGGKQVDLNKISEMLKAEPIIENGWIARFSKEVGKGEK